MRSLTVWLALTSLCASNSIDWCEYWTRMGRQSERPECANYELSPDDVQLAPAKTSQAAAKEPQQCPNNEIYACLDCEPTCHNLVPKCRKVRRIFFTIADNRVQRSAEEQCNKGCVCRMGMARGSRGSCVQFRECPSHSPPEEEGTVMKTVRKMVPVIVNDVWKAFFASIRQSLPEDQKELTMKPINESEITGSPIYA